MELIDSGVGPEAAAAIRTFYTAARSDQKATELEAASKASTVPTIISVKKILGEVLMNKLIIHFEFTPADLEVEGDIPHSAQVPRNLKGCETSSRS